MSNPTTSGAALVREGAPPPRIDRLCPACARVPVDRTSPYDSFFCRACTPRVVEANRQAGRLVIPVAAAEDANGALFPPSRDDAEEALGIHGLARDFPRQIAHLDLWSRAVRRHLPRYRGDGGFEALVGWFSDYWFDAPEISPALRSRIENAACSFVLSLSAEDEDNLRFTSARRRRSLVKRWAGTTLDEVIPCPAMLWRGQASLRARRQPTYRALVAAGLRHVDAMLGEEAFAPAFTQMVSRKITHPPRNFGVAAYPGPFTGQPDWLPSKRPRDARLVISFADGPAPLGQPIAQVHLSMGSRHQWWVLWVEWRFAGGHVAATPAAFAPRGGLAPFEAAYLALEVFLGKLRAVHGLPRPPRVAQTGILGEYLVEDLIARVWPELRQPAEEDATPGSSADHR